MSREHAWIDRTAARCVAGVDAAGGYVGRGGLGKERGDLADPLAREILCLGETLEQVAVAAGCRPAHLADAYGHVLEAVSGLKAERDRLAEELEVAKFAFNSKLVVADLLGKEVERLKGEVEAELRGQVEISTAAGSALDKWRGERARIRRELLDGFAGLDDRSPAGLYRRDDIVAVLDRTVPEDPPEPGQPATTPSRMSLADLRRELGMEDS